MEWGKLGRLANTAAIQALLVGVGVLGGIMLVALLPGMPWSSTQSNLDASTADLAAQRSMAAAAWYMVLFSAVSVVVGGVGLVMLIRTLEATRQSADTAERALAISQTVANETREIGRKQVRAYLAIQNVFIEARPGPPPQLVVVIKLINSGQSPAKMLSVNFDCRLTFTGLEGQVYLEGTRYRPDLAATVSDEITLNLPLQIEVGPWVNQWRLAEVVVAAKYHDVFRDWHIDDARFIWDMGTERQFEGDWQLSRRPLPGNASRHI